MTARLERWLLVVGECGDGKSTLINNLLADGAARAEAGKRARGVTKDIQAYHGKPLDDGTPVLLLDTPGVGDKDVTPMQLVTMIEAALLAKQRGAEGGIDGVLVTTPVTNNRLKLGAQVVQLLVEKGFVGGGKWLNVILVGTKADLAEPGDLECFRDEVVPLFFESAPGGCGPHVTVSRADVSALRSALLQLPNITVRYEPPSPKVLAGNLAGVLGVSEEAFSNELGELRVQLAAMAEQNRQLMDTISEQTRQHYETMARLEEQVTALRRQADKAQEDAQDAENRSSMALQAIEAKFQEEKLQLQEQHARQLQEANRSRGGGCCIL